MARAVISSKETQGIEFTFQGADKREARFTLWTQNAQGEQIWGYKQLMALMTCMKVRSINPIQKVVKVYCYDRKEMVDQQSDVYPDLMKPIGIVFQKELYVNFNGEDKSKVNFHSAFDPQTKQMAKEILDKEEAKILENIIAGLQDKDSRAKSSLGQAPGQGGAYNDGVNPELDDLPF